MKEERYAQRIRQALNHGLKDLPPAATRRLEAARHLALSRQKQAVPQWALSTGNRHAPAGGSWQDVPYARQILAIVALLLGMWISFYWHSTQYVSEIEEVDSALLADDLPPEAFLDDDFFSWLTDDSSDD
jgi:2-keto-4-pentenoate hydratase